MFYGAILFGNNDERNNGDQGVLVRSVLLKNILRFPQYSEKVRIPKQVMEIKVLFKLASKH